MKEKLLYIKSILEEFFSYLHVYDIAFFVAFLLLAMCFVFLSFIAFRRKLLSIPLFLIGFAITVAIPFLLRYFMEERFYKVEGSKSYDSVYNYSDVYQYIAKVKNIGKRNIAGCIISHWVLYDISKDERAIDRYKHMILNYVKPKKIYNMDINLDLKVGQTIELNNIIEDYEHRGEPYTTKVECYGKKRYKDDDKVLQGIYEPIKDDTKDNNTESSQEAVSNTANNTSMDTNTNATTTNEATTTAPQGSRNQEDNTNTDTSNTIDSTNSNTNTINTDNNTESSNTNNIPSNTDNSNAEQPQQQQQDTVTPQGGNTNQPTQQNTPDPDWREKRDNFMVPLLKESPR